MNANDMTFGVEIETTIPRNALSVSVGPHGSGNAIPEIPGWKADNDPSIRARGDHRACEFVSPVFKGVEGLKQCLADLEKIRALGAKVNTSCGLHVHIGIDKSNAALIEKLITQVANCEKAIYASTGTKKREQSRWCNGVNRYGAADTAIRNARHDRYHVCNLSTGGKPTVEFRAFAATLNPVKLASAVMMCVGIVERAIRAARKTDWTAKKPTEKNSVHRGGDGQTAVARLFYQLGWTKGRQSHVHGNLQGEGIPTLKQVKAEVMRLAKKYDAPPTARAASTPRGRPAVGTRVRLTFGSPPLEGVIVGYNRRGSAVVEFAGPADADGNRVITRYTITRRQFTVIVESTPTTAS